MYQRGTASGMLLPCVPPLVFYLRLPTVLFCSSNDEHIWLITGKYINICFILRKKWGK